MPLTYSTGSSGKSFRLGGGGSSSKPKGGHGVFGVVENLGKDIEQAAIGIPMGTVNLVRHPIKSIEQIGKSTWQDWSPLFHGHPGQFLHQTYEHPLAPLLDIASIATAGVGAGARLGGALADAGAISEESSLAKLGAAYRKGGYQARVVTHEGPRGTMHEVYAKNPLTRAIQKQTRGAANRVMPNWGGGKYERLVKHDEALRGVAVGHVNADVNAAMKSVFKAGETLANRPKEFFTAIDDAMHRNLARMARHTTWEHLEVRGKNLPGLADKSGNTVRAAQHQTIHAPEGVAFIPKQASTKSPYGRLYRGEINSSEDVDKALKNWGRRHTVRSAKLEDVVTDEHGVPLVVPTHTVNLLLNEAERSSKLVKNLYHRPTQVWKHIILTTPRFFTNNAVGNSIMAMVKLGPMNFVRGTISAVKEVHGNRVALKSADAFNRVSLKALGTDAGVIKKWYLGPHSEGFGYEAGQTRHLYQKLEKRGYGDHVIKAVKGAETGLFDITHRVSEKGIRALAIHSMLRNSPDVRALMKDGKSFSEAVDTVSADPAYREVVQHDMDNILGQYHYYNGLEQHMRRLVPFYGWDRAIMRHSKSLALENPGRAVLATKVGDQGVAETEKRLGDIPSFMRNLIPLGNDSVLSTQGFNPYQSVPDTLEPALSLVGLSDQSPGEALSMQVNPYLTGLMETVTGQSLLSGAKIPHHRGGIIGSLLANVAGGVPQVTLAKTLAEGTPQPKSGKPFLYSKDPTTQMLALLGVPIKKVNKERAAELAKAESHVTHHRTKKPKFALGG